MFLKFIKGKKKEKEEKQVDWIGQQVDALQKMGKRGTRK